MHLTGGERCIEIPAVCRMGGNAGRWQEEAGGMERQMEAQLDVTARWQGEPLAKWIKRLEWPRVH